MSGPQGARLGGGMPGGFDDFAGFGMPPMMGGAIDSNMAQEYMKLQNDFFKWQNQLMQNQHVLHSRVAPIASNPPTLQGPGVRWTTAVWTSIELVGRFLTLHTYAKLERTLLFLST